MIRTSGSKVTFDSSATKPAPTGSQVTDVHGRQVSRGQDDDSRPASCLRGGQEGSSIRETSNQTPQQEGGCPTGDPRNIPSSSTPGNTLPQLGSVMRASPRNPLKNLTYYRSAGWKKDLDHILGSFYHYNYTSHKEAEWKKLKTKFFEYLGQCQEEWRDIKEEKPLQYMPSMESHFQALTSVRLKGLSQFKGWIKSGSYYHGVVARKGQLHMCLHLAGTEPPHSVTQKEEETPTTSLHMPGKEGSMTQGECSDSPTPMETGGTGDGQSWAEQAKASTTEEWRRGRSIKHHWLVSRKWEGRSTNPFPLQDNEGRCEVVQQLYWHADELTLACHDVAAQGMAHHYPGMESGEAKSLNNQVLCMISEYHLTCLSQGSSCISPVLLEAAKDLFPPIEEYLADDSFHGTRDLRVEEKSMTLWVAVWLHHLDMAAAEDGTASLSLDVTQHGRGPLLEFLLALKTSSLTFEEVV